MERRNFIVWLSVAIVSTMILLQDLFKKILLFILGPKLTPRQEVLQIQEKVRTLESNVHLEKQREERLTHTKIFVCDLKDLKKEEGILIVDFYMKPGLAFLGNDGKPILISSVCTHLGCTILNRLNDGKLFCPCHNAYFELKSGKAIEGPAKLPLSMIPYVVENNKVYLVKEKNA